MNCYAMAEKRPAATCHEPRKKPGAFASGNSRCSDTLELLLVDMENCDLSSCRFRDL
jgi:hypothetical protein